MKTLEIFNNKSSSSINKSQLPEDELIPALRATPGPLLCLSEIILMSRVSDKSSKNLKK